MTTISRARFESITRYMVERMAAGPQKINCANQVHPDSLGKRVEATAEQKAFLAKIPAAVAAAEAHFEAFQREHGIRADAAYYAEATYTKFGKMSTEEKEAYVQQKLAQFDAAEALHAKYQQEIEKNNTAVSPAGQSDNANTATPPLEKYLYKESREMYLPNISDLSLANARKAVGFVELAIENREDAGRNVHGHYGDQAISDLNTYLAALKDYISKIEVGVLPTTSSEPAKGTASTGG